MSLGDQHDQLREKVSEARTALDDALDAIKDIERTLDDALDADEESLNEIRARLLRGDLSEAVILIGRLHPALADLPHVFERRA